MAETFESEGTHGAPFPELESLKATVAKHFEVLDAQLYGEVPSFAVKEGRERGSFKRLYKDLRPAALTPVIRRGVDALILRIYQSPKVPPSRALWNLASFLLTLATITWFGFMLTDTPIVEELKLLAPRPVMVAMYVAAMLAIFGLHELGHEIACKARGLRASLPYFIPGLVGGTFGAVIVIKEPPANKDDLFDIGFSGPLLGLAASIAVAALGISTSPLLSASQVQALKRRHPGLAFEEVPIPLIFALLMGAIKPPSPSSEGFTLLLNPLAYAGWIGLIVNFLNLLPAWQLDGGRIFTALLGAKGRKYLTWLSIAIMFVLGFWPMAILIALLSRKGPEFEALDEVLGLSPARKALATSTIVILALTAVRLPLLGL